MSLETLLSYALAALAACGNALANVMQRKAGLEEPADRPFGVRLLFDLVRSPTWLLGFVGLVGSFVLQAVALGFGQLSGRRADHHPRGAADAARRLAGVRHPARPPRVDRHPGHDRRA